MNEIERFKELVGNSDNIVFFGGAGVSTESGIPDFRSVDGLYNQKYPSICIIRRNFTVFIAIKCWHWMPSRIWHIKN